MRVAVKLIRWNSGLDKVIYFYIFRNMESSTAVNLLGALAQESRLSVFRLLVEAGPQGLSAGEISEELAIPASTLSFHLKDLNHAGLLDSERQGRSIIYSANYAVMNDLLQFMQHNCCKRTGTKQCK